MKPLSNIMFRPILLFIILFLIFLNTMFQLPRFINSIHILKTYQLRPIGREFVPLIPFLRKAQWVGYMTCLNSSHPLTDVDIMGPYQQAQFVLVPTILDYFHPFDYHYLILQCPDAVGLRSIQGRISSYVTLKAFDGVSLLYR